MAFFLNRKLSKEVLKIHKTVSKRTWFTIIVFTFLINYSFFRKDDSASSSLYLHGDLGGRSSSFNLRSVKNFGSPKNRSSFQNKSKWKKILLWTPYFGQMDSWNKIFKRLKNMKCEENRCQILFDKKRLEEADAVLFNANDLQKKALNLFDTPFSFPDPKLRKQKQKFVFFSSEPPGNMKNIKLDSFNNYFNWTMTYRRDSDVFIPYGKLIKKTKGEDADEWRLTADELRGRKSALWMVSHCDTQSKREVFARELQKHLEVDIYGICGPYKCGDRTTIPKIVNDGENFDPCDKLISNYTFYLALENSICTDYVTEKLYRSLQRGSIPVVLGGANYSVFAPENSYINAKDFETVEDLAKYMIRVSKDPELFNKYFKWKTEYNIELGHPYNPHTCDLCKKLHSKKLTENTSYEDMQKWYVAGSECFSLRV